MQGSKANSSFHHQSETQVLKLIILQLLMTPVANAAGGGPSSQVMNRLLTSSEGVAQAAGGASA
jgi:hypothetical protein